MLVKFLKKDIHKLSHQIQAEAQVLSTTQLVTLECSRTGICLSHSHHKVYAVTPNSPPEPPFLARTLPLDVCDIAADGDGDLLQVSINEDSPFVFIA